MLQPIWNVHQGREEFVGARPANKRQDVQRNNDHYQEDPSAHDPQTTVSVVMNPLVNPFEFYMADRNQFHLIVLPLVENVHVHTSKILGIANEPIDVAMKLRVLLKRGHVLTYEDHVGNDTIF